MNELKEKFGNLTSIHCKKCNLKLNAPVKNLEKEGLLNDGKFYGELKKCPMIHLKDFRNVKPPKGNGCCGQDGLDGLNTECMNGHKVGVEKSDCWMPHCFIFDSKKVTVKEWS